MYIYMHLRIYMHIYLYILFNTMLTLHNVCMKTVSEFTELCITIHPDLSKLDNTISHANV